MSKHTAIQINWKHKTCSAGVFINRNEIEVALFARDDGRELARWILDRFLDYVWGLAEVDTAGHIISELELIQLKDGVSDALGRRGIDPDWPDLRPR